MRLRILALILQMTVFVTMESSATEQKLAMLVLVARPALILALARYAMRLPILVLLAQLIRIVTMRHSAMEQKPATLSLASASLAQLPTAMMEQHVRMTRAMRIRTRAIMIRSVLKVRRVLSRPASLVETVQLMKPVA